MLTQTWQTQQRSVLLSHHQQLWWCEDVKGSITFWMCSESFKWWAMFEWTWQVCIELTGRLSPLSARRPLSSPLSVLHTEYKWRETLFRPCQQPAHTYSAQIYWMKMESASVWSSHVSCLSLDWLLMTFCRHFLIFNSPGVEMRSEIAPHTASVSLNSPWRIVCHQHQSPKNVARTRRSRRRKKPALHKI